MTNDSNVLTFEKLGELVGATRRLITELDKSVVSDAELQIKCEQLLQKSDLAPEKLPEKFFQSFESGE